MKEFTFLASPARVIFGAGTIERLGEELAHLEVQRPLVVSTPGQEHLARSVIERSGVDASGFFAGAAMHTPVAVTEDALAYFDEINADGIVAVGGGSTIGLGKAIALRNDAPQLVLPTTYAGSEMTGILGETKDGHKETKKSPRILPETVIYDVDLTLTLPLKLSVTSGMNAIAHAVEAMYSENANPVLDLMAEEGVRSLSAALSGLIDGALDNREIRAQALYGAWLCANCLGLGGVALHHKLCHVLGGSFDLPHAPTHTVLLPHALAYNEPVIPEAIERLRRATGSQDPASYLFDIAEQAGVDMSLKALGMSAHGIGRAVEITLENPYPNPRPLEREGLTALLTAAFEGERPR